MIMLSHTWGKTNSLLWTKLFLHQMNKTITFCSMWNFRACSSDHHDKAFQDCLCHFVFMSTGHRCGENKELRRVLVGRELKCLCDTYMMEISLSTVPTDCY